MATADYDYNDFTEAGSQKADENLLVRFYMKPVQDKAASAKEGRPIFKEKEYIEIRVPGSRHPQAARPVTYRDKQRFHRHYEAYKARKELAVEGTVLSEWPAITRSQVQELEFFGVKTVEQLASVADSKLKNFAGLGRLKQVAVAWLEESKSEDTLKQENKEMKGEIEELKAQMAHLLAGKGGEPAPETPETPAEAKSEDELYKMTKDELNDYAAVNNIADVDTSMTKDEMVQTILAA